MLDDGNSSAAGGMLFADRPGSNNAIDLEGTGEPVAYTQAEIDALKTLYARGITRATLGDQTVEFQSLAAMRDAINVMDAEVNTRITLRYAQTSKGLT